MASSTTPAPATPAPATPADSGSSKSTIALVALIFATLALGVGVWSLFLGPGHDDLQATRDAIHDDLASQLKKKVGAEDLEIVAKSVKGLKDELAGKADKSALTELESALAMKANATAVETALAGKADNCALDSLRKDVDTVKDDVKTAKDDAKLAKAAARRASGLALAAERRIVTLVAVAQPPASALANAPVGEPTLDLSAGK